MQLYAIMAGMLTGEVLAILKNVLGRNGYEAYRQIYSSRAPKTHNKHLALLMSATQATACTGNDEFVTLMCQWEEQVSEFELVSTQRLAVDNKRTMLIKSVPQAIRSQIMYNIDCDPDYPTSREASVRLMQIGPPRLSIT